MPSGIVYPIEQKKRCSRCREPKDTNSFKSNRGFPDGLGSYCKPCDAVLRIKPTLPTLSGLVPHRIIRPYLIELPNIGLVKCCTCKTYQFLWTDFYKNKGNKKGVLRGYALECKTCERKKGRTRIRNKVKQAATARRYFSKHKDEIRERNREKDSIRHKAYNRKHPDKVKAWGHARRARQMSAPINDFTASQWKEMKAHYGYKCVYCGKKPKRLTIDHIIPLVVGGNHTMSNIVPACGPCNYRKSRNRPPVPVQPLLIL